MLWKNNAVLKLITSIITSESLLIAHISQVNADPVGLGANFEATATHLMLADPIEMKELSRGTSRGASIFSTAAGRGDITGVDLRWYNPEEFRKLTQDERTELARWRKSDDGKAVIAASLKKYKADKATIKKRKSSEISGGGTSRGKGKTGGDGGGEGGNDKVYTKKKYQAAVAKAAKKMCAASIAAEKAEVAAADMALEAAIQRRNGTVISATNVVPPVPVDEDAVAEQKYAQAQTALKLSSVKSSSTITLSSVKSRINKLKKGVCHSRQIGRAS